MALDRSTVEKVTLLARLRLNEEELDQMTEQLGKIVGYIDQLNELNTDDVEPLSHAVELTNVFADDIVAPSLPREQALENAPKKDDAHYQVPAVLGE